MCAWVRPHVHVFYTYIDRKVYIHNFWCRFSLLWSLCLPRGGTKPLIFHVTFCIPMCVIKVMTLYRCCVEAWELGSLAQALQFWLLVTSTPVWYRDPWGSPMKTTSNVYYVKSMGTKVITQHFCPCTWCFRTSSGACPMPWAYGSVIPTFQSLWQSKI